MARSEAFRPREGNLHIDHSATTGPVSWLAPTQATFSYAGGDGTSSRPPSYGTLLEQQRDAQRYSARGRSNVDYKWTSRNSRKGRHALQIGERSLGHDVNYVTPEPTNRFLPTLKGLWRMITRSPLNDLSYLTAVAFVSGCTLLLVNAFLSVLPRLNSDIQLPPQATLAQSILTLLDCTLFLTSSLPSYLEAVNTNKESCFGWSPEQTAASSSSENGDLGLGVTTRLVADEGCEDHYRKHSSDVPDKGPAVDGNAESSADQHQWSRLRMLPTFHELRISLMYDLGFLACSTLLASSVVY